MTDAATTATVTTNRCDGCGEECSDIDAGFSPGLHAMAHGCGGTWRQVPLVRRPAETEQEYALPCADCGGNFMGETDGCTCTGADPCHYILAGAAS